MVGIAAVEKDEAGVAGWRRSIVRYLVFDGIDIVVGNIFPVAADWIPIVVVAAALFDQSRQGLHDRAAGVVVVEMSARP